MDQPLASKIHAAHSALFVEGNLESVGEFFSPDYLVHVTGRDLDGGHGLVRQYLGMLRSSFPDLEVEVEILLEGEDRVAWQRTLKGKHEGAFMGFPASGRPLMWRDMATSRFCDGLIAEEWTMSDLAERLLLAKKR